MMRAGGQPQTASSDEVRLLNRLVVLMSKTNEPMAMGDGFGNLLDVNQPMCTLMNSSRDRLLGMRVPDFLPGGESEALRNRGLRNGAGTLDGETTVQRPDGTRFRARFWDMEVRLEDGGIRNFIGLSTDAAALESPATNAILRIHFDDSPDGKLIADKRGRTIYANRRHREMWKLSPDELLVRFEERQEGTYALMADPAPFKEMARTVSEDRLAPASCKVRLVTGETFEVRAEPLLDNSGRYIGHSFSTRDITLEQERDRALRESEDRYRKLVSSLPVGVVLQISDNRIGETNETAERILGMTRDELLGLTSFDPRWKPVREDGSPMPPEEHPSVISMRTGESCKDVVIGMDHINGGFRWLLVNSVAMRDENGLINGTVISFQDITEQRRAQAALIEARTAEAYNSLASGVAHKVNNSLATIVGNAYIAGLPEDLPADTTESLSEVIKAASDATAMVRDLLALSGRVRNAPQLVDVTVGVGNAVRPLAMDEQGRILLALDHSLPTVLFDERSLEQVTTILLRNALEAGTSVQISTRIESRTGDRPGITCASGAVPYGNYVAVEVSDNGPGLATEIIGRVFQPFASTKFTGRGLGLAAAAGIAASYHSFIEIESSPNGCVARLLIPLR